MKSEDSKKLYKLLSDSNQRKCLKNADGKNIDLDQKTGDDDDN